MGFTIIVIVLIILILFLIPSVSLAPYLPMWSKDLPRVFEMANLQPGEKLYDLGCGDGKVVFYAAKQHPKAEAIGIELSLPMYIICQLRKIVARTPNAHFRFANALKADISDADVVYVYTLPDRMKVLLIEKFERELKPGARVISYAFELHGKKASRKTKPKSNDLVVYEYRF